MRWTDGTDISHINLNRLANSATSAYTVYIQDGQAIAESNMPDGVDYDSGTHAEVINNAITATGDAGGGTVFLKGDNTFDIGATTIAMNKTKTNLIGDGFSTIITTSSDIPLITITRPVTYPNGQIIANLSLIGPGYTNTSAHAFDMDRTFYNIIDNIYVSDVRDVFNCVETEYLQVRNVKCEPLTEWGTTGECWRGIYLDKGVVGGDDGGMVNFEECFFYRPRCAGVVINELEIGRFHRVIVAEPGYGEVAGWTGIGFEIIKPNSYTTFDACESDTTHGDAWHLDAAATHMCYLNISDCFGFCKPESTGRAIYIKNMWGAKINGGEFRSDQNHVVEIDDCNYVELGNCELRAHNRAIDPGTYFDGIQLNDAEFCRLHDFHLQTAYTATGKTGIVADAADTCVGTQIVNASLYGTGGSWPTLINVPHVYVEALQGFSYQEEAGGAWVGPTQTAGAGTKVVMRNTNLGQSRVYYVTAAGWQYAALT